MLVYWKPMLVWVTTFYKDYKYLVGLYQAKHDSLSHYTEQTCMLSSIIHWFLFIIPKRKLIYSVGTEIITIQIKNKSNLIESTCTMQWTEEHLQTLRNTKKWKGRINSANATRVQCACNSLCRWFRLLLTRQSTSLGCFPPCKSNTCFMWTRIITVIIIIITIRFTCCSH